MWGQTRGGEAATVGEPVLVACALNALGGQHAVVPGGGGAGCCGLKRQDRSGSPIRDVNNGGHAGIAPSWTKHSAIVSPAKTSWSRHPGGGRCANGGRRCGSGAAVEMGVAVGTSAEGAAGGSSMVAAGARSAPPPPPHAISADDAASETARHNAARCVASLLIAGGFQPATHAC